MRYCYVDDNLWGPEDEPPNWLGPVIFVLAFAIGLGVVWLTMR